MKQKYIILILILLLATFLRAWKLGSVPFGLNNDETAIGYNAYSILETGKDEYGQTMPLYFRSFDDYKLPVYIYMTAISEKMFGVDAFAVRFPSMFFGVLSVFLLYVLILDISKRIDFALISSMFLAVNPWHIFFSRIGFEVNVATALALLGTVFFFKFLKRLNYVFLFFSFISFILSMYCYNVARIISPTIFCALIYLNYKKFSKIPRSMLIIFVILFFVSLAPLVLTLRSHSGLATQESVLISGYIVRSEMLEFRSYFFLLPQLYQKIFFNSFILMSFQYLRNVFGFFSLNFFFINGASHPINGVGNVGMFYFVEFPFVVTGIFLGIKRKVSYLYIFYLWMLLVVLVGSLTREVPHPTRSYMIIIPMIVFSAYGFLNILTYVNLQKKKIMYSSYLILFAVFGYSIIYFINTYLVRFPVQYAKTWRAEDKELVLFLKQHENIYKKIIIDNKTDFIYTSLLFHEKYSPRFYQQNAIYKKAGLLNVLSHVGKYEFKDIDWARDYNTEKLTLFITDPSSIGGRPVLKTFYYPTRPVVNTENGNIIAYPYTEPAYVLIEAK